MIPNYSQSAYEPIFLIKEQVEQLDNQFDVEITNRHNGSYILYSKVKVEKDSVRIDNDIQNDYNGTKSDTTLTFLKTDFIKLLNTELLNADAQIKIAGNYQAIKIIVGHTIKVFYTRQGLGLMNVMGYGK